MATAISSRCPLRYAGQKRAWACDYQEHVIFVNGGSRPSLVLEKPPRPPPLSARTAGSRVLDPKNATGLRELPLSQPKRSSLVRKSMPSSLSRTRSKHAPQAPPTPSGLPCVAAVLLSFFVVTKSSPKPLYSWIPAERNRPGPWKSTYLRYRCMASAFLDIITGGRADPDIAITLPRYEELICCLSETRCCEKCLHKSRAFMKGPNQAGSLKTRAQS